MSVHKHPIILNGNKWQFKPLYPRRVASINEVMGINPYSWLGQVPNDVGDNVPNDLQVEDTLRKNVYI